MIGEKLTSCLKKHTKRKSNQLPLEFHPNKRKVPEQRHTTPQQARSQTKEKRQQQQMADSRGGNSAMASAMGAASSRTTSKPPAKKLVIKAFKKTPKLPNNFEENMWNKLQAAVKAVYNKAAVTHGFEELYQAAEDLCRNKMGQNLYNRLEKECRQFIGESVNTLAKNQSEDPVTFLQQVETCWQDHCSELLTVRSVFLYLDRTYVIQNTGVQSIWDLGLSVFRENLEKSSHMISKSIMALLNVINSERKGESVNRSLLKNLLRMFSALKMYDRFESEFLRATEGFYSEEGVKVMQETEVPDYLKHTEQRLQEEGDRVIHYLDGRTRKPLIRSVENCCLRQHLTAILEKGFDVLLKENRMDDLKRMYTLFARVDGLEELKNCFGAYMKKIGVAVVTDTEKEATMVQELLDFREKLDAIVETSFAANADFVATLKDAFSSFINARQNKPAELIAKYVDTKLRAGNKGMTEDEMEQTLDRCIILFRCIQGKDVFEAFFKKDLAKRLLLGKSASLDAEKSMISKLKTECGSSFTTKLEGMFKDIDLSKDIMSSFKQHHQLSNSLLDIDLNVHVLTTGFWPAYTPMEIKLPTQLAQYQEVFKKFYLNSYNGRRLMWQNTLGHCMLRANFGPGKKELAVSLFQTVVLMLFNEADSLSFKDIVEQTGIEEKELRRTLQSLACAKVKVLHKRPKGREVNDDDVFHFNKDFTHKLFRIKVNSIQMKETVEENQSTNERVFQDRQYQIDAAIVRIMKARKTLSHNLLVSELYAQLKFPIKPVDIKKRIESLLDRDYLERSEEDSQLYIYLA